MQGLSQPSSSKSTWNAKACLKSVLTLPESDKRYLEYGISPAVPIQRVRHLDGRIHDYTRSPLIFQSPVNIVREEKRFAMVASVFVGRSAEFDRAGDGWRVERV